MNYKVNQNEMGLYHVKFNRKVQTGKKEFTDTFYYQSFTEKEYKAFLKAIEVPGLSAITQYDEMELIHNPKDVKQDPKPKGRPVTKKEE